MSEDAFIPLSVPCLGGRAEEYTADCVRTEWVSSVGAYVGRFEEEVAAYTGARHAVATVNGTAALHLALVVAGIEPGDEVLCPALTFIATANAIRYAGAWPVFIDAEPAHGQMAPADVERFCREECEAGEGGLVNRATGRRVRAVLPTHVIGHAAPMEAITGIAQRYNLLVVEDVAEALGTRRGGAHVGRDGLAGCLSFNGNKIITTGGGGMIITDDAAFAERARHLSTQAKSDPQEYIHDAVGFNYRLTNLQAALGCAQMERLDEFVAARRAIAGRYRDAFADVPGIELIEEPAGTESTFWLSTVWVEPEAFGCDARALMASLAEAKIQSRPLWQPLPLSPAHAEIARPAPVAEKLWGEALSLPSSAQLTEADQQRVVDAVLAWSKG